MIVLSTELRSSTNGLVLSSVSERSQGSIAGLAIPAFLQVAKKWSTRPRVTKNE